MVDGKESPYMAFLFCFVCRSPLELAGRKALHILDNISLSKEELVRRSQHLKPPDGMIFCSCDSVPW